MNEPIPVPPGPPRRRGIVGTVVALVMVASGIVGASLVTWKRHTVAEGTKTIMEQSQRRAEDLPRHGKVADFALIDRSGKPVTTGDLLGRVWVAETFFTYCGGICVKMNKHFGALHREFVGVDEPKFVSITCDPGRDTLTALVDHARTLQADPERWWFLTGEEKELQRVVHSLLLPYEIGKPASHSGRFVLVDRTGEIRGAYEGTDPEKVADLARDMKLLLAVPPKG